MFSSCMSMNNLNIYHCKIIAKSTQMHYCVFLHAFTLCNHNIFRHWMSKMTLLLDLGLTQCLKALLWTNSFTPLKFKLQRQVDFEDEIKTLPLHHTLFPKTPCATIRIDNCKSFLLLNGNIIKVSLLFIFHY